MPTDGDNPATGYETIVVSLMPITLPTSHDNLVRHIRLTSDRPKINVGRASKTVSKGLVAAAENAYFDSPVVSRVHAEIAGNLENGTVSITDMGSLHGTSVNDKSLEKGVATPLEEDDTVNFGIHVSRGLDVFGPMACKVAFKRTSARPVEVARSYCAPDPESGLSDASDSECSSVPCDDTDYNVGPIASVVEGVETIDLTFVAETADLMDTTVDCETESDSQLDSVCGESVEEIEEFQAHDSRFDDNGLSDSDENGWPEEEHDNKRNAEDDGEAEREGEIFAECEAAFGDFQDQESEEDDTHSGFSSPPPFQPCLEASPNGGDLSSFGGLRTPPSVPAEEFAAGDYVSLSDSLIDKLPRNNTTVKCDISSILNPSPPLSSPPKLAVDDVVLLDPIDHLNTQDVLDATASWGVSKVSALLTEPSLSDSPQMTSALTDCQADIPSPPTAANLSPLADSSVERAASSGQHEDKAIEDMPGEDENVTTANTATMSDQKAKRKRKAEEMTADTEGVLLSENGSDTVAKNEHVSSKEPAAKRRATPAAIAAKKTIKRRMWAAAEKIGIAALGGAVVLGTLIYTAPTF
ncbi:hypothetical protein SEPCBS57363_005545 [Sporothrix epigloea]|uniref:FHA domain-containing protein n=1 Tax=Sporothrix epigloea TaxID=1892477 RepID=A0ABP0E0D8_9PEZI